MRELSTRSIEPMDVPGRLDSPSTVVQAEARLADGRHKLRKSTKYVNTYRNELRGARCTVSDST
jgi:hypothetical protein